MLWQYAEIACVIAVIFLAPFTFAAGLCEWLRIRRVYDLAGRILGPVSSDNESGRVAVTTARTIRSEPDDCEG